MKHLGDYSIPICCYPCLKIKFPLISIITACPSLKKARVQKIFSSSQLNCSRARRKYNVQELRKAQPELRSPEKSGGEGSFGLVRCLDGAAGVGEGETARGEDMSIGGRATAGAGVGPVMSWVSCYSWTVRPMRVALIVCSEVF